MRPPGPKVQAFGGCRGTSGDRVLDSIRRLTEPARGVGNAGVPPQHFVPHIFFGLDPMMVSTVVLCVTYGVIIWDKLNRAIVALLGASVSMCVPFGVTIWDKLNRAIVALLGASVMVLVGALDQNEALKGIDWNTIGLLTGMMILVSISRRSGMFEY